MRSTSDHGSRKHHCRAYTSWGPVRNHADDQATDIWSGHSCGLSAGHYGRHRCYYCGYVWRQRPLPWLLRWLDWIF